MPASLFRHVAVVGAGAWGTALALTALRAGRRVTLLARDPVQVEEIRNQRRNRALPDVPIPEGLVASTDLAILGAADLAVLAVPMRATRAMAEAVALVLPPGRPILCTAKGIEPGTLFFVTEVVADVARGHPVALLSGPSFAADVARGLPTAVTLAAADVFLAQALAQAFATPAFRPYHGDDVRGVEVGGAAKNVLAVAAGIVRGRGLGESARAALVTRGFAELRRLGATLGARPETLMGLSGLGDLMLTAGSPQSRNTAFGMRLGQGATPAEAAHGALVEGAGTAVALADLARRRGVSMPIVDQVAGIVAGAITVEDALSALLNRPPRAED